MLEFHPFAMKFPLLEGEEFEAMKESVRKTGGNGEQPIKYRVVNGKMEGLDGRNRLYACMANDIEPTLLQVEVDDSEVIPFIIRQNVIRRHIKAALRQEMVSELAKHGQTIRQIAATVGVSTGTVHSDLNGACSELNTEGESAQSNGQTEDEESDKSEHGAQTRDLNEKEKREKELHDRIRTYIESHEPESNKATAKALDCSEHTVAKVKLKMAIDKPLPGSPSKPVAPDLVPTSPKRKKKHPKNGRITYDWNAIKAPFGKVVRATDEVGKAHEGEGKSREFNECRKALNTFWTVWESWQKKLTKV